MLNRVLAGVMALFVLSVLSASALAITTPTVTFIPDKISTNGAFIMIANPHAAPSDSVIVTWGLNGPANIEMRGETGPSGSFPMANGKFACYFSNTDNESTCGPSPIKNPSSNPPRSFIVYAVNQDNTSGAAIANISVGGIQITPSIFTSNGKNISIRWSTACASTLSYKVYYAANYSEVGLAGFATYSGDGYFIDIPSGPGNYFISLRIDAPSCTGDFGGTIIRYEIPESGIYSDGGPVNLAIDTASFEVLLNRGQSYQRTGFSMTNYGNIALSNLSVAIPADYSSSLSIILANNTIAPNGTIFYTLVVVGPQHTMEINTRANVTSGGRTIGQIPVRINVSVVNECEGITPADCPAAAASGIAVNPSTWTGSYLAGEPAVLPIRITNSGNQTITNLSFTSDLGYSLTMDLPESILSNGVSGYAPANATLTSSSGGEKSGTITITSSHGSATLAVLINFYDDISSSLSELKDSYAEFQTSLNTSAQRNALVDAFTTIDSDISSAESAQENGEYQSAADYYNKASAGLDVLKSAFSNGGGAITPPPSQPIDITLILIIALVVVGAVLAFIFIKRRQSGGEDELEEELGEDFGPLPPVEGQ